jgi:hypothetical protein
LQLTALGKRVSSDATLAICKHCGVISTQPPFTEVVQAVAAPHCAPGLTLKSTNVLQLPWQVQVEHCAGVAWASAPAVNASWSNKPLQLLAAVPAAVCSATGPCQPLGAAATQRSALQSESAQSTLPSLSSSSPLSHCSGVLGVIVWDMPLSIMVMTAIVDMLGLPASLTALGGPASVAARPGSPASAFFEVCATHAEPVPELAVMPFDAERWPPLPEEPALASAAPASGVSQAQGV